MLHALCSLFHILSGLAFIYIFIYLFIYLYFFCFIHPCPFSRFATVSALLWHFGRHFCSFPAGCWCVWVRFHWFLPWVQSVLSQLADFISFDLIFLAHLTRFSSDSFILLTSSFFFCNLRFLGFGFFLGWNWFAVFGHFGVWCIFRQFLGRVFLFSFEDFYSVFFLQRLIFFCPTFTAIFGIYSISFSLYSRFWLVYDRYFAFSNGFLTSFLVYSRFFFFTLFGLFMAIIWSSFLCERILTILTRHFCLFWNYWWYFVARFRWLFDIRFTDFGEFDRLEAFVCDSFHITSLWGLLGIFFYCFLSAVSYYFHFRWWFQPVCGRYVRLCRDFWAILAGFRLLCYILERFFVISGHFGGFFAVKHWNLKVEVIELA